jgi:hypothetical protein
VGIRRYLALKCPCQTFSKLKMRCCQEDLEAAWIATAARSQQDLKHHEPIQKKHRPEVLFEPAAPAAQRQMQCHPRHFARGQQFHPAESKSGRAHQPCACGLLLAHGLRRPSVATWRRVFGLALHGPGNRNLGIFRDILAPFAESVSVGFGEQRVRKECAVRALLGRDGANIIIGNRWTKK